MHHVHDVEAVVVHRHDVRHGVAAVADHEGPAAGLGQRSEPVLAPALLVRPALDDLTGRVHQVRRERRLLGKGHVGGDAQEDGAVSAAVVMDDVIALVRVPVASPVDGPVGMGVLDGVEALELRQRLPGRREVVDDGLAVPLVDVQQPHRVHELADAAQALARPRVERLVVEGQQGRLDAAALGQQAVPDEQGTGLAAGTGGDAAAQREVLPLGQRDLRHAHTLGGAGNADDRLMRPEPMAARQQRHCNAVTTPPEEPHAGPRPPTRPTVRSPRGPHRHRGRTRRPPRR